MSKLEPRFRAGVLVEENIYFSHARFNGLFKLDINSMRCSFIKEFCGCEIEMKDIHVAGTRYGDWIIFLPAMGNCIHLYNYVTDEMRCVKLNRYKNKGEMVCDAYTFEKKLYVIPHFLSPSELELPFWEMDLESFEIIERWDVNDDFKRKLDVSNELCILSTSYFDNSIWFVIHKSDKICRLNLESGETDVYDAHVENICSISVDSECIWLSQEDGSIIQWDIQEGIVHKYNNEVGETRGSAVSRVLEAGNKIISVPAYAEYISVKDEGDLKGDFKAKRELQINIIFKNMVTFGKYINHTDRYILCPYNVNGLYEMLKKNGEIKYRPFEQQIYFSDFKVRESYLNKILAKRINENQEYKIEDFCQDIMSLSGKEKSNIREDIIGDKIYKVL